MKYEGDAREYHEGSKHGPGRLAGPGFLDWAGEPGKVKHYKGTGITRLPDPLSVDSDFADILEGRVGERRVSIGLPEISTVLQLGYGVTRGSRLMGEDFLYRAAPSAGALYPADIYICCPDMEGLEAGIYYFNPHTDSLATIREGDFRRVVSSALDRGTPAQAYLLITAIPGRSAGRYGRRAYRYSLLDSGHLTGNLLLAASALGFDPSLVTLLDAQVLTDLLGLDRERELVLAAVPILPGEEKLPPSPTPFSDEETRRNREHPEAAEASDFRKLLKQTRDPGNNEPKEAGDGAPEGIGFGDGYPAGSRFEDLIRKRASFRKPARRTLPLQSLWQYLNAVTWAYPADWRPRGWSANHLPHLRLLSLNVRDLQDGLYVVDTRRRVLTPTGHSPGKGVISTACLGQRFVAEANAVLAVCIDFELVRSGYAYRVAGLDGGLVGQLAYLAAEALGGGCCGIGAFIDDELSQALNLDLSYQAALYALTLALR